LQVAATLLLDACFHLFLQQKRVHYSLAFPHQTIREPQMISQDCGAVGIGCRPNSEFVAIAKRNRPGPGRRRTWDPGLARL